jgi:hypothetical protein
MGHVIRDFKHPDMWRVRLTGGRVSDLANLTRAKDAALTAAIREIEWEARAAILRLPPLAEMAVAGRA